MEKTIIEMTRAQFFKEMSVLKSMSKNMAIRVLEIGDEKSKRLQLVMHTVKEIKKNNLDIDTLEKVLLVHNTETGEENLRLLFNAPTLVPKVETPIEHNSAKRMTEVLQRLAGWLFTLSSGQQTLKKEDADKAIEDINYALYGTEKPPIEYKFVTGKEATEASAKVFWRINESVIQKLVEACEFAKAELECSGSKGENYNTLAEALESVYKHFGLNKNWK